LGEDLAEAELPAEEGRDGGREADSEEEQEEEVEDRSRGIVWSAWQALCAWFSSMVMYRPEWWSFKNLNAQNHEVLPGKIPRPRVTKPS
jgi:hypothetical protein